MRKNKISFIIATVLMLSLIFVGCVKEQSNTGQQANIFDTNKEITVVARDSASGTRGAFHEIMEIIQKEGDKTVDNLIVGALEFDGTDKVITAVEQDKYGIGYISLGSVSERIKAIAVSGVEPTIENVKSGAYSVARPFLLVTKGTESDLVKDFLSYTESVEGQKIVYEKSFISAVDSPKEYVSSGMSGTIKIAGSTSVAPLMEKLQEEYNKLNPDVKFEMQANGSSQGIKAATDGSYDIGMSSRELKAEEAAQLNRHVLAIDGIAVIISNENPIDNLAAEDITAIYTGEKTVWTEVK